MSRMEPISKPCIVVVGGFLGAGKTTLLLAAAKELERRGLRSAIVMNDQGDALVDSRLASVNGLRSGEVTGGCFCCRFSELVHVMDELRKLSPDVIFAEPVGSCTDISATTLQPLREYSATYRLAPFTVLVDPARANELLHDEAEPNMKFLFDKQIVEADVVCFTKADMHPHPPVIEAPHVRQISAKTGRGVAAWLDEMLSGKLSAGAKILDIDYEQYARAEAALAWLNIEVELKQQTPQTAAGIVGPLLDRLDGNLAEVGISIVHLKVIIQSPEGFIKASLCANGQEPSLEGDLLMSPSLQHKLLVNLRAIGAASQVQEVVRQTLERMNIDLAHVAVNCFHPAPPTPERRFTTVA